MTIPLRMPNLKNMKYEYFGKIYLIKLILNGIFTLNRLKTITQIR